MNTRSCLVLLLFPCLSSALATGQTPGPDTWILDERIMAYDGGPDDKFGSRVAISGDTLLIGTPYDDHNGVDSGSAYVYVRTGSGWTPQAKIDGGAVADDEFGHAVALEGDVAVIGAWGDDDLGFGAGAAYVFTRSGSTWTQQTKLTASDGGDYYNFGNAVDLSGDTVVVGSSSAGGLGAAYGAAYVFVWSGSIWRQEAKLEADLPVVSSRFGTSVSIHGDTVMVGATLYPPGGRVYVFERAASVWSQQAVLEASDGEYGNTFGMSLSLDGDTVLIGAPGEDDLCPGNPNCHSGAAYVFERSGSSWAEQDKLLASDPHKDAWFGWSVSLRGGTALIGAPESWNPDPYTGSAYVFGRLNSSWSQQYEIVAGDAAHSDFFGTSVALEGNSALIGAPGRGLIDLGAAYVYRRGGPPGELYCFGDSGSGTPCPCNNDNDGSVPESGCANGVHASGAQLTGSGVASITSDTLVLTCTSQEPFNSGLYFQGNNDASPGLLWGDGLQCAGGFLVRLQVRQADMWGDSSTTVGIAAKAGNVSAGEVKHYQCWYRNPAASPCGSQFNASNGYKVIWTP